MSIHIHPIKAFNDNYIWTLINENNKQAIVIDPGQAAPVIQYLEENELELTSIWTTHHHHDHIGGVAELQESYPMTHLVAHAEHNVDEDQTIWQYGERMGQRRTSMGCVWSYCQSCGLYFGHRRS